MRGLRIALGVLLAIAFALVTPLAIVASWTSAQVDDTDAYVETVGALADDDVVQREVGEQLTSSLLASAGGQGVEVPAQAEQLVEDAVADVLDSSEFRTTWSSANRTAHEQLVAVLRGDATAADGDIVVSLADLYNQAAALVRAQGVEVADRPDGSMRFRMAPPDRLEDAQDGYQALVDAGTWLPVVAVVLLVLAVLVPPGRSRIGVGIVAAMGAGVTSAVLLFAVAAGGEVAATQVAAEDRDLASAVIDVVLDSLETRAWIVIGVAAVAVVLLVLVPLVVDAATRRRRRGAPA